MSYQVIARKYRPQKFADVVGQEHVTQTLSNAIEQKRIAHAYLFCGPRGTGKTTIARIFAKCLNCTGGPKVGFNDSDPKCIEITEGRSVDVLEIDGASNNGVEQVRELRETVKYMPASSRFKIYIIDEVHMLTTAAFNALLKTLEEPPEHVKFMFATTDPEKVLPTILSRCQRFDLRRIPAALIVKHLQQIADLEKVKIDRPALYAIARGADGGMRDAESTLDQLISFCGEQIEEGDVLSMFGLTAQSQILEITRAILAGEAEPALRQLHELAKHGKDLGRLLSDLLNHFRNLLVFRVAKGDLNLVEVSEAEAASLASQSAELGIDTLTRIMEVLANAESRLRDAASKRTVVEVSLLKAIEARTAVSVEAILKQLNALRENRGSGAGPGPVGAQQSAPKEASRAHSSERVGAKTQRTSVEPPAEEVSAGPAQTSDLQELWRQVLEAVGRASQFTRSYLLEAHPVSFDRKLLIIAFDPEFRDHIGLVDNSRTHSILQTKLQELGWPDVQVKFIEADAPAKTASSAPPEAANTPSARPPVLSSPPQTAPPAPAGPVTPPVKPVSSQASKEDFRNDPLIQKALEIFKGRIVEVRG